MSDTLASLRRKIEGAEKLAAVVRTMKAMAASSIGQYEAAVRALDDYQRSVELGLGVCLRSAAPATLEKPARRTERVIGAIVFGSDQGLVGRFNEVIADFARRPCTSYPARSWSGQSEARRSRRKYTEVYVFHNRPQCAALYEPVSQRQLPLDAQWRQQLAALPWPTKNLPQTLGGAEVTLDALVREYLFISLYKACAESLASEIGSRLAAMQRADENIATLSANLGQTFHRLRQSSIDEELFDVTTGFNALSSEDTIAKVRAP
jgi:F-type H+-transporting ATPase subunit gamma